MAGIRRSLPSAFQQPNAIHENNGWNPVLTGGRKSVLQVLQPQATLESSNHWLDLAALLLNISLSQQCVNHYRSGTNWLQFLSSNNGVVNVLATPNNGYIHLSFVRICDPFIIPLVQILVNQVSMFVSILSILSQPLPKLIVEPDEKHLVSPNLPNYFFILKHLNKV